MPTKLRVDDVTVIFGPDPNREALPLMRQGSTKADILRQTGHVVATSEVSFTVGEGEVFVIMGLSGSGKSTLVRCINRLIEPTTGEIEIDGEDVLSADKTQLRAIRRTKMAMVFQHFALFSHKTVRENVAYGLKAKGVGKREREEQAQNMLAIVGLEGWGDRHPHNLSGGMKQRVGLARALTTNPDILLMDEPFSALDPLIRRQMQEDLLELQESIQKTVVFVTHDLDEAVKMGSRIAIMQDGRLIQVGTPEDIVTNPVDDYVEEFVQDVNRGHVVTVESVMRPSAHLVAGKDTVLTAIEGMQASKIFALHIADESKTPMGLVTSDVLAKAKSAGIQDLLQIMNADFPQVSTSATLNEVYNLFTGTLPVAVVDADNTLVGRITPRHILEGLQ